MRIIHPPGGIGGGGDGIDLVAGLCASVSHLVNGERRVYHAAVFRRTKTVNPYNVGILGATGMVGQRLVQRLAGHPWFRLVAVCGSERSEGKAYAEAARWSVSADPPAGVRGMTVRGCRAENLSDCDLVLSGLDATAGRQYEAACADAGLAVVSNSSAHRQGPDVPLLIPEINADHLSLISAQQRRTGGGFIVTNPNCSVTGLALALAPLHAAFGVERVVVSTMQAVSGAGLEGPRALEMIDNVLPFISGEEEKLETELAKILGRAEGDRIALDPVRVSAHCHRVLTLDGHLESVSVGLARPAEPAEAMGALAEFRGAISSLHLPTAPERPVIVRDEPDRPQPRLDRDAGAGMSVVVGRVRRCPVLTLRMVLLSHNTVRGAAGATVLNAELLAARGHLPRRASR